jgi:hypothetical protein
MARKIYYKIIDDGSNKITDEQWETILRLQHWYNSEFMWTAGRLGFKMYAVFPNLTGPQTDPDELRRTIARRFEELHQQGFSYNATIQQLESEGLIIAQKGGYFDKCLASGFTRVAANEFNAYLVCEFLLKTSRIAQDAVITVYDEGQFIKSKAVKFSRGGVILQLTEPSKSSFYRGMVHNHHVFAIVDAAKYDQFPRFSTTIVDYNELSIDEKLAILKDWNWLGFEDNFDLNGDDVQGFNLNKKVEGFDIEDSSKNS